MNTILNGDGKFLRISLGNLLSIGTTIVLIISVYYKLDSRVAGLEHNPISMTLSERTNLELKVTSLQEKIDEISPKVTKIQVDTAWLVARAPNSPK